jgi:hypothetical protein
VRMQIFKYIINRSIGIKRKVIILHSVITPRSFAK